MSFETTRILIATKLGTIPEMPFPVEWEGGTPRPANAKTWGRLSIQQGSVMPAMIGPGHTRSVGMVYLQVFIPEEGGTRAATLAADILSEALDRVQLAQGGVEITFDLVGIMDAGRREGYTQKNISCAFTRDVYRLSETPDPEYGVYFRPDGVSKWLRPDGVSEWERP